MLAPLGGIFLLINLVVLAVTVFALIDASVRPPQGFVAAEKQTKQFWIVVLVVAVVVAFAKFLTFLALIAALVYLLDVRPAVRSYR